MILFTREGERLEAPTLTGIVHRMWATAHIKEPTLPAYMAAVARRAQDQCGARVRATDPETFVADLLAAGLLVRPT